MSLEGSRRINPYAQNNRILVPSSANNRRRLSDAIDVIRARPNAYRSALPSDYVQPNVRVRNRARALEGVLSQPRTRNNATSNGRITNANRRLINSMPNTPRRSVNMVDSHPVVGIPMRTHNNIRRDMEMKRAALNRLEMQLAANRDRLSKLRAAKNMNMQQKLAQTRAAVNSQHNEGIKRVQNSITSRNAQIRQYKSNMQVAYKAYNQQARAARRQFSATQNAARRNMRALSGYRTMGQRAYNAVSGGMRRFGGMFGKRRV